MKLRDFVRLFSDDLLYSGELSFRVYDVDQKYFFYGDRRYGDLFKNDSLPWNSVIKEIDQIFVDDSSIMFEIEVDKNG